MLEQGAILAINMREEDAFLFIDMCFKNRLISGVHLKSLDDLLPNPMVRLFVTVAAPGVDRIRNTIRTYGGDTIA